MSRITDVYYMTIKELKKGIDVKVYVPVLYVLQKIEDYEAMEGIRRAFEEYGHKLEIPEFNEDHEQWMENVMTIIKKIDDGDL